MLGLGELSSIGDCFTYNKSESFDSGEIIRNIFNLRVGKLQLISKS